MPLAISKLRLYVGAGTLGLAAASGLFLHLGQDNGTGPAQVQASLAPTAASTLATDTALSDMPAPEITEISMMQPTAGSIETVTRADAQPVLHAGTAPATFATPDQTELSADISADINTRAPDVADSASITLAAATDIAPEIEEVTPLAPALPDTSATAECTTSFTALAAPGAMVDLTLDAPCRSDEAVDIFHAGIRLSARLDATGYMQLSVPAMEQEALFNVLFSDGFTASAELLMLTMSDFERVALSWKGAAGFDLYALENGADYGSTGHVSATQPYGPDRATAGEGGFFTAIGESPHRYHAVFYSWPERLNDAGRTTELSVEAAISSANCDTEISGTVTRVTASDGMETTPLVMSVPTCSAIGEYLVLKNLRAQNRLASN